MADRKLRLAASNSLKEPDRGLPSSRPPIWRTGSIKSGRIGRRDITGHSGSEHPRRIGVCASSVTGFVNATS